MPLTPSEQLRFLRGGIYFVAIATIVTQLSELIIRTWPVQIHTAAWRLSFVGGMAGMGLSLLFMMVVLLAIATLVGDRIFALVIASLSLSAAVVYFVLSGAFVLDVIQMRNSIQMSLAKQFDVTTGWVLARQLVSSAGFAIVGVAGLRSVRAAQKQMPPQSPRGGNLIVGMNRPSPVAAVQEAVGAKES